MTEFKVSTKVIATNLTEKGSESLMSKALEPSLPGPLSSVQAEMLYVMVNVSVTAVVRLSFE